MFLEVPLQQAALAEELAGIASPAFLQPHPLFPASGGVQQKRGATASLVPAPTHAQNPSFSVEEQQSHFFMPVVFFIGVPIGAHWHTSPSTSSEQQSVRSPPFLRILLANMQLHRFLCTLPEQHSPR